MIDLTLAIERLVIVTEGEQRRLERVGDVAQRGFLLLAERLKGSPFERWGKGRELLLEEIAVSTLSLDDLLGTRGAERLADELYKSILGARG